MFGLHLGKSEQDLGVCLKAPCPHCQRAGEFKLRQRSAVLTCFGYPILDFGRVYELMCSSCKFCKELADDELPVAEAAIRLYQQLGAGELNPDEYAQALEALNFPARKALGDEAAAWRCSVCKEQVPATLNACWKCSTPRPGLYKATTPETGNLPRLPDAVTRPSNPWEQ
jgi:hypothetical protein